MMIHSLLVIVSSVGAIAIADEVPDYNFASSCRAVVEQMPGRLEKCLQSEQEARTKLSGEWAKYPAADRTSCVGASSSGGSPSYVELLVCLGMKGEVRDIRRKNPQ